MALSDKEIQEALQKMKDANTVTQDANNKVKDTTINEDEGLLELKRELEETKRMLAKEKSKNSELNSKVKNTFDSKTYLEQQQAMDAIIQDSDAKYFTKKYKYDMDGSNPIEISIKMHAPNAMEMSAIEQEFTDMTNGRGTSFDVSAYALFRAIAHFKVVGDVVPDWFTDLDICYRWDILIDVFYDFDNWQGTFRNRQRR